MFERFTEEARAVVVDAQLHARRLGHGYLGCEHLLLALPSTEGQLGLMLRRLGMTTEAVETAILRLVGTPNVTRDREALAAIGIDLDAVREKIEANFGPRALEPPPRRRRRWGRRGSCAAGSGYGALPFTPRAKECLGLSLREAVSLGQRDIGSQHIALALTDMTAGLAPQLLSSLGMSPSLLRTEIFNCLRQAG
ncbi:MAG: Clp protease N-terminal domain-containing protein [Nocardioidaceae bacterium]